MKKLPSLPLLLLALANSLGILFFSQAQAEPQTSSEALYFTRSGVDLRKGYEAEWVSQTQPASGSPNFQVQPGEVISVEVRFRNVGTATWYKTGDDAMGISVYKDPRAKSAPLDTGYDDEDSDNFGKSYFHHSSWESEYNIGGMEEAEVKPGEIGTFRLTFQVPEDAEPGTYREDISVSAGKYWVENRVNGDENSIAHIWVGVEVQGEIYTERVVYIEQGEGPEQVGYIHGGEGAILGPDSFNVDNDGNIYICDTTNSRLQIYNHDGTYKMTIQFPQKEPGWPGESFITDVVVDDRGNIYVYDDSGLNGEGEKLWQYDKEGNFKTSFTIDEPWEAKMYMQIIAEKVYMITIEDSGRKRPLIPIANISNKVMMPLSYEEMVQETKSGKYDYGRKGYYYDYEVKNKTEQNYSFAIDTYDNQNNLVSSRAVSFSNDDSPIAYLYDEKDNI